MDYVNNVMSIVGDKPKFLPLDVYALELCQKNEKKLVPFLRDILLKKGHISNAVYHGLFPQVVLPVFLYGLPKVHKPNSPIRPIPSAIGTYNNNLANFLVPLLQPLISNPIYYQRFILLRRGNSSIDKLRYY